jgi:hypothetical protein
VWLENKSMGLLNKYSLHERLVAVTAIVIPIILLGFGYVYCKYGLETILQSVDVGGFLGIFVPAIIGLMGSFWLYSYRREKKRDRLKISVRTELEALEEPIDDLADELADINPHEEDIHQSQVPPPSSLSTQIYEANVSELKLLSDELLRDILGFYTKLLKSKETIELLNEDGGGDNVDSSDIESLCEDLGDLSDTRDELQQKRQQ